MKDLVIVFLLALAIGSALNSWKGGPQEPSATSQTSTSSSQAGDSGSAGGGTATAAGAVINATDANFDQEVLKADLPVMVDFWAPWCGPCREVAPVVDKLAKEYQGRLKVVRVNVDENQKTGLAYEINPIPAFYFFQKGAVVNKIIGLGPDPQAILASAINKVCAPTYDAFAAAPQPGNADTTGAAASLMPPSTLPTPAASSVMAENEDVPLLDENGFDRDVIKSASPVLVFFFDTSEPCQRIWPTVLSVASKVSDNYRVVRVDMAKHPALAQEYYVSRAPTFVIFKDGHRVKQLTGVLPEQDLLSFLRLPNTAAAIGASTF